MTLSTRTVCLKTGRYYKLYQKTAGIPYKVDMLPGAAYHQAVCEICNKK